jgi:hypothetical protein
VSGIVLNRFGQIAMADLGAVAGVSQVFINLLGDHHRAMMAARASESDRQIALPFANIMRQQVNQQIGNALDGM